jgi:hypothetical protein
VNLEWNEFSATGDIQLLTLRQVGDLPAKAERQRQHGYNRGEAAGHGVGGLEAVHTSSKSTSKVCLRVPLDTNSAVPGRSGLAI